MFSCYTNFHNDCSLNCKSRSLLIIKSDSHFLRSTNQQLFNYFVFYSISVNWTTVFVRNWTYSRGTLEHASGTSLEWSVQVYGIHHERTDGSVKRQWFVTEEAAHVFLTTGLPAAFSLQDMHFHTFKRGSCSCLYIWFCRRKLRFVQFYSS